MRTIVKLSVKMENINIYMGRIMAQEYSTICMYINDKDPSAKDRHLTRYCVALTPTLPPR